MTSYFNGEYYWKFAKLTSEMFDKLIIAKNTDMISQA